MTKKQITNWYSKALARLNDQYYDIRSEFSEDIARKVINQKLDKINEMRDLRLLQAKGR